MCLCAPLVFFMCRCDSEKLIIVPCSSCAMDSNGFVLLALPIKHNLQAALLNRHGFRTRIQKCCYGRGAASVSWKLMGRETLHTQWFPRRPRAEDTIQMPRVLPWFAYGRPCRIAKRYVCAENSLAVLLGVFVAHPLRTLQIAKTSANVSSNRLSVCAFC